jgi:GTP-binding protein
MRTVAIIGRPNVGKSTLFNRLIGRRRALVHDLPGVTRDRLEGEGRLGELEFRVVDTAGLDPGPAATLEGRLQAQTLAGLEAADLGIFLIDARAGITSLDQEIAALLRRSQKPILLLANKVEGRAAHVGLAEAWMLGLGNPIPVSAEHGDGLPDLLEALRPHLAEVAEREEPPAEAVEEAATERPDRLRLAVVGRPNVGKSSLVNRLLQSDRLLTGPEPGLTRDSVQIAWSFEGRSVELVDTAGLRRRSRVDATIERLAGSATVRAIREAHVVALVLDAMAPLEHQDLTIANLALDEGRALVLVVNKWDLVPDRTVALRAIEELAQDRLAQVKGITCVPLSARTGRSVEKLLPAVIRTFDRWRKRVPTGQLNRWLEQATARQPPPMAQNRRIKIRYMTQVAARPPTFALFANKPVDALPSSYVRYLTNGLREAFGLEGVPLRLEIRHSANPYAEG